VNHCALRAKQLGADPYLAMHMRRGDFTHVRRDTVPSLDEIVTAASQQCTQRQLCTVFMATDAAEEERLYLKSSAPASLKLAFFDRTTSTDHDRLHDAERAIVEQLLCTWADWFTSPRSVRSFGKSGR